jgi:hypothetical protein
MGVNESTPTVEIFQWDAVSSTYTMTFVTTFSGKDPLMEWVDVNHDGDLDLLIFSSDERFYLLNNRRANDPLIPFRSKQSGGSISNLDTYYRGSIAAGDADNDGDADLALVGIPSLAEPAVVRFISQDTNTFNLQPSSYTANTFLNGSLAWADINHDAKMDLVVAGANQFQILKNEGNFSFKAALSAPVGVSSAAVAAADYDRDG